MTYPIYRLSEGGLFFVDILLNNKFKFSMILDTGATNTTIDSNALHLIGYDFKNNIGIVDIETGNGIIETEIYELDKISSLGVTKNKFHIQVYDFLAHGILTSYDGLLGLDFFEGTKFCIDTNLNVITVTKAD